MRGKYKKPLKERCPVCNSPLQIRVICEYYLVKGVEVENPVEYIACSNSNCYYEEEIEQKKSRRRKNTIDDNEY